MRIAGGSTRSIEAYGDIYAIFRSGDGLVHELKTNVVHLPDICHHLFSLPSLIANGHTFEGRTTGVVIRLSSERLIVFPLSGTLCRHEGYRIDCSSREHACLVLGSGQLHNNAVVDINDFHCATGYFHKILLRKTPQPQGIVLEGELPECRVCSMAKGLGNGTVFLRFKTFEPLSYSVSAD